MFNRNDIALHRSEPSACIEPLEERQLFAAVYAINLPNPPLLNRKLILAPSFNTLTVNGTNGNDQIRITRTPTQIVVNVNGRGSFAPIKSVARIQINAMGGNDRVLVVDPAGKPVMVDGGAGNDYITSGPGDDLLLGGAGRDWIQGNAGKDLLNGGAGDDSMEGGAGDDILIGDLGSDRMFGQTGNDVFYAKDGQFDMVDGGIGSDRAQVDLAVPAIDGRNSIEVFS